MKVNFAHLCDYAIVSQEGKLSVLGIFDNVHAGQLPAIHQKMVLAFQIVPHPSEVGNSFEVCVQCVDQDGGKLFELKGTMKTAIAPGATMKPGDRPRFSQVMEIAMLKI